MKEFIRFFAVEGTIICSLYFITTFLVLLLNQIFGNNIVKRLQSQKLGWGNVLGALFGAITPFCSCTAVPMLEGLLRAGVRFGVAVTFLVASPLVNEIVIILMFRIFGLSFASIFVATTIFFSIAIGVILDKLGMARYVKIKNQSNNDIPGYVLDDNDTPVPFQSKLRIAAVLSFTELKKTLPYILLGLTFGGAIYGFIPDTFLLNISNMISVNFQVVIFALIGAPLYFNMISALPVAFALIQKGMLIGPMTAFLIGGAGTSIAEMILLSKIFKLPLLLSFILSVIITAICIGLLFNLLTINLAL